MAIHEIRESIIIDEFEVDNTEEIAYIEKVIPLKTGFRHTVNAIDVFIDNMWVESDSNLPMYGEIILSAQPLLLTNQRYGSSLGNNSNRTPPVSTDTILYKMLFTFDSEIGKVGSPCTILQEFPNNFLGSMPTFSWYTPRLYMYVVLYEQQGFSSVVQNLEVSAYVAVNSTRSNHLSYMLGNIRERSIAQIGKVLSIGRLIPVTKITGQKFPMYLFGGARSQFMLNSTALQTFYYNVDPQAAEGMLSTSQQRDFLKSARNMVSFDKAFGKDTVALGGVPDWLKSVALTGVVSGAIREQWPPLKYNDNGNVRMM